LRAVSELVSAALLALIAVAVGGAVVALLLNQLVQQRAILQEEVARNIFATRQAVGIVLARVDPATGDVEAVVVTGDTPTKIEAVYIDERQAQCSITLTDGTPLPPGGRIPPYTAVLLTCTPPAGAQPPYLVRIVYPGGAATALAE